VIASVAVTAAWALDRHTGRAVPRCLRVTASLGAFGVLHWWDPILLLTGVNLWPPPKSSPWAACSSP
jgi:hypothetical protein